MTTVKLPELKVMIERFVKQHPTCAVTIWSRDQGLVELEAGDQSQANYRQERYFIALSQDVRAQLSQFVAGLLFKQLEASQAQRLCSEIEINGASIYLIIVDGQCTTAYETPAQQTRYL